MWRCAPIFVQKLCSCVKGLVHKLPGDEGGELPRSRDACMHVDRALWTPGGRFMLARDFSAFAFSSFVFTAC